MRVQKKKSGSGTFHVAIIIALGVVAGFYGWIKSADILNTALAACGGLFIGLIGVAITRIVFAKKET